MAIGIGFNDDINPWECSSCGPHCYCTDEITIPTKLKESNMEKKLEDMTNAELKRICKDRKIPTADLRNKKQLLDALAGKGLTAVESEDSPLNEGIEKEKLYLGKCPKTGEKLYKVVG